MWSSEPLDEALRNLSRASARKLRKRLRKAAKGDEEAVHGARTTIRRLREMLRVMGRTAFDRQAAERLARQLKDLEKTLGPVRDDDVLLDSVRRWRKGTPRALSAGMDPLEKRVARRRKKHARALADDLTRKPMRRTMKRVRQLERGRRPPASASPANPANAVPALVRHVVADQTWRAYDEVLAYDTRVPTADFDVMHKVRSACRRLRYLLELFAGAVPSGARDVVTALRELQDRLGALHDHVVALETIRAWLDGGRVRPSDAIDAYLRDRTEARDRLRAEFDREWRSLMSDSFRHAIGLIASGEMRSRPDGAIRLVPPRRRTSDHVR
jgi:CHAD domain-containing protein